MAKKPPKNSINFISLISTMFTCILPTVLTKNVFTYQLNLCSIVIVWRQFSLPLWPIDGNAMSEALEAAYQYYDIDIDITDLGSGIHSSLYNETLNTTKTRDRGNFIFCFIPKFFKAEIVFLMAV